MLRCILRAKIHMATVTDSNLAYEGSITIDEEFMKEVGILPHEQVTVSNLNNGERFVTYAIPGKAGSRDICLNGPTARKGVAGDRVIVFCYGYFGDGELEHFEPRIIRLDADNQIIRP